MKRLVSIILNFMIKNNVISKDTEEIEFYRYGIEITLSSLINIALISIIGIVTNYTFESTMFLAVFIIMRSFTGGYHANTYIKCNLVTSISFVILFLIVLYMRTNPLLCSFTKSPSNILLLHHLVFHPFLRLRRITILL